MFKFPHLLILSLGSRNPKLSIITKNDEVEFLAPLLEAHRKRQRTKLKDLAWVAFLYHVD